MSAGGIVQGILGVTGAVGLGVGVVSTASAAPLAAALGTGATLSAAGLYTANEFKRDIETRGVDVEVIQVQPDLPDARTAFQKSAVSRSFDG